MSNIDEKAKNDFTIEMRVFGYWFPPYKKYIPHRIKILNARDVLFSGFLCVVSWYSINGCVGNFVCSMFKAFLGNALNTRR